MGLFSFHVAYAVTIGTPHLHARVGGVDVGSHTTAYVGTALDLEDDLTRGGITQVGAIALVLVAVPDIEAVVLGVGNEVDGVAVAHAGVVESCAVVVNGHGTVCNLVVAVAIDIGNAQVVVALSGIRAPLRIIRVKHPSSLQRLTIPVPCHDDGAGVVATTEKSAWELSSQVSHACEVALRTVAALVAPGFQFATFGDVGLGVEDAACETVEDADVFWA